MQLFVGEANRSFLGERLDAFLSTTTLDVFKKHSQQTLPLIARRMRAAKLAVKRDAVA
jgi:hypothetical protein